VRNKIPRISNEEVISTFSMGVADIKVKEKLSRNDELTSMVRLFEIADRCAKAEEGGSSYTIFWRRLSQSPSRRTASTRRLMSSRQSLTRSTIVGTTPSVLREDDAATTSSTSVTPTILMIVGFSKSSTRRMESPSTEGAAGATAEAALEATAATTTRMRVTGATICHVWIPSLNRCLHQ
jgi:hypothetical protein